MQSEANKKHTKATNAGKHDNQPHDNRSHETHNEHHKKRDNWNKPEILFNNNHRQDKKDQAIESGRSSLAEYHCQSADLDIPVNTS